MYVFGIDTPLVEVFFLLGFIILIFFVLLVVAIVLAVRLNRRLNKLNRNELVELERLKKLEGELYKVLDEEKDELAFFDYMRKQLGHMVHLEEKNIHDLQELKKPKRLARKAKKKKVVKRKPRKNSKKKTTKRKTSRRSSKKKTGRMSRARPVRVTVEMRK